MKKSEPVYLQVTGQWTALYEEIMNHSFKLCIHDALSCAKWYQAMLKKLKASEHEVS